MSKKPYEKPTLVKRNRLPLITASSSISEFFDPKE